MYQIFIKFNRSEVNQQSFCIYILFNEFPRDHFKFINLFLFLNLLKKINRDNINVMLI